MSRSPLAHAAIEAINAELSGLGEEYAAACVLLQVALEASPPGDRPLAPDVKAVSLLAREAADIQREIRRWRRAKHVLCREALNGEAPS